MTAIRQLVEAATHFGGHAYFDFKPGPRHQKCNDLMADILRIVRPVSGNLVRAMQRKEI
jgi:hypothetical protein